MNKIILNSYEYTISFKREYLIEIYKCLSDYKDKPPRPQIEYETIFQYYLAESIKMEYYSFLDLMSANFKYDTTLNEILKSLFKINITLRIEMPSEFYDLKDVIEEISIKEEGWVVKNIKSQEE